MKLTLKDHKAVEMLKKELELDLIELEAYRNLDNEVFDFGEGEIRNDGEFGLGSEDVYYKIQISNIENILMDLKEDCPYRKNNKNKKRINKYYRKRIDKKKLEKLDKYSWWAVYFDDKKGFYKRYYLSGRKKFIRKCSNKKVRKSVGFSLKGAGYRKCYDFWWELF